MARPKHINNKGMDATRINEIESPNVHKRKIMRAPTKKDKKRTGK